MSAAIAAEWVKLRKRWMPRILLLIMLVIIGLLFWGLGSNASGRVDLLMPRGWLTALTLAAAIAPFLWPILGGSWAGSEYSWGTIRLVLSRRPSRTQFVLAGLSILALYVGLALIITLIFSCIAAAVVGLLTGQSIFVGSALSGTFLLTLLKTFLASWYVLLFYVALSFAMGTVFRSGAVGIGVGIGLTLAELVITGIFLNLGGRWETIARHFPDVYARSLPPRVAADALTGSAGRVSSSSPGVIESILWLGAYIAIPIVITLILVRMRDVTA